MFRFFFFARFFLRLPLNVRKCVGRCGVGGFACILTNTRLGRPTNTCEGAVLGGCAKFLARVGFGVAAMTPGRVPGEATAIFLLREYVIPIVVFALMAAWLLRNVVLPMCAGGVVFTREAAPSEDEASSPEARRMRHADPTDAGVSDCSDKVK
ncbi:uncharacterized protein Tco025E_00587 [Trypanosoma conorhini]|uniref:Uncharacterized protein n=1 Tax=Trypanosoma conorhini TaxID=83891 RepID=A0A422QAZ6_9TRYP|nr:uncharacterized protein Tco025E_00587 [Trypanosoma conorhini]RNF27150.1 hypothetical protein Tco025E_00587 [Trypanosoma conorhini]